MSRSVAAAQAPHRIVGWRSEDLLAHTAAPLERNAAQKLREAWEGYLLVVVVGFVIAITAAAWSGSTSLVIGMLVALPLASLTLALFTKPADAPWRASLWAVLSWLSYHQSDRPIPGIIPSPTGTSFGRHSFMALAAFVVALASFRWLNAHGIYPLGLAFAVSLFAPLVVMWVPFGLAFPIVQEASRFRGSTVASKEWPHIVAQMQSSNDPIEKDSIFMGNVVADGSPLLVPRAVLKEHVHFLGDSGSGKTSRGLIPLIEQLAGRGDCSVVFVDLKADTAETLATLEHAAAVGRTKSGSPTAGARRR